MSYLRNSSFTKSMKGKVIIAFLVALIALFLAWTVSKVAFREMLVTVQNISSPDEKLRVVNKLFRDITRLDQLQRAQAFQSKPVSYREFLKESDSLRSTMDSLRKLYAGEPEQVKRVDRMKRLLNDRDRLFVSYLRVREGLVNSRDFSNQLNSLTGLISRSSSETDSTVVTTEQKFSTLTVVPEDPDAEKKERDNRSLLGRIFGSKKKSDKEEPQQIVKEEVNITVDTLSKTSSDSVIQAMERAVKTIERKQKQRSTRFVNRETELANAGNILIGQMLVVLQEVEKEVIRQVELNNQKATAVVSTSARRIETIMFVFVLVTAFFVYLILTDISRSNAYREELEAAKEEAEYHGMAKQRFLSSMSHEIRTPLQSIIGYAEQIRDQNKPSKTAVDAVYHSSVHLLHIVNEVLDYSRIVSGKFRFTRSTFHILRLLDEVMLIIRPQAEAKSLKLTLDSQVKEAELITGDPFRLKQILINLLGNAIKFTDQGEVSLTVTNRNINRRCYFTFEVRDTGPGIAAEDLASIFDEFEQADATAKANANGTGLGLSIVKALTEGQGGTVEVESEPGKGSCFTVKLRYVTAKENKNKRRSALNTTVPFKDMVWLVDDDRFILELCCTVFEKRGIRHRCFGLPSDLLAQEPDSDLKVVMMDMRMPQMNGYELCRLLREKLPPDVKIYALTAQVLPDERRSVLEQGFDGLLMKPFREEDLLNMLGTGAYQPPVNGKTATNGFDLSAIEKMAFGDQDMVRKIVERFAADSSADIEHLKQAVESGQSTETSLLLHRIAGRTAQIGAKELASKFRAGEMVVLQTNALTEAQKESIAVYIDELDSLIGKVNNYSI